MKKITAALLLLLTIHSSFACDLCGCNSGNYFIGPLPQFNTHFVSLRYSFQRYNTTLTGDNSQFSNDLYQTAELLLGTRIKNKWQLLAFIPYNQSKLESDDGVKESKGLGDITLNGNYNIMNKIALNKDTNTVDQQLWIGAGVKFPTGKFNLDEEEIVSSTNSQPGSGSFDFLLNALYVLQLNSWGLNVNVNYKINQSANHFKFGNVFSPTAFLYRSFTIGTFSINPNIGLLYETISSNKFNNEEVADTGGHSTFSSAGLELKLGKIALGGNILFPMSSNLSNGQTHPKSRGICHISLLF